MKFKLFVILSIFGIMAVSCKQKESKESSVPESVTLKVNGSELYGEDAQYVSLVKGKYELKAGEKMFIKVKMKLLKKVDAEIDYVDDLFLKLKDADGLNVVDGWQQMIMPDEEYDKLDQFLQSEPGTEQEFIFVSRFDMKNAAEIMRKAKSFTIDGFEITYIGEDEEEYTEKKAKQKSSEVTRLEDELDKDIEENLERLEKTVDLMDRIMDL